MHGLNCFDFVVILFFCSGFTNYGFGLPLFMTYSVSTILYILSVLLYRCTVLLCITTVYNQTLPCASLASVLSTNPLQLLVVPSSPLEELWLLANVPLLRKRAVKKSESHSVTNHVPASKSQARLGKSTNN